MAGSIRPAARRARVFDAPRGAGSVRHHRYAGWRRACSTRRWRAATSPRSTWRRARRRRSTRRRRTRARGGCGPTRTADLGQRVERRPGRALRPAHGRVARVEAAWERPSAYAVYVDEQDTVWLTDLGSNAIVRFDPTTETFEQFVMPQSGADIRAAPGPPRRSLGRRIRPGPYRRRTATSDQRKRRSTRDGRRSPAD